MNRTSKANFFTLGCRLNQAETSIISKSFENIGYEIVGEEEHADLAVINTCTVTENSDAKCRNLIRKVLRKNPDTYIAVIGCYSQVAAEKIAQIEGVDIIVGNQDKMKLAGIIDKPVKEEKTRIIVNRIERRPFTIDTIGRSQQRTRANLKIQDGCDFMCSFCIIPFARGRARPREWNNLTKEVAQLADAGFKEIVLTGVNIGTFEYDGRNIVDVVDLLNGYSSIERVRISSIEPTTIPDGIIERMADSSHSLVPHLHIPLQSGSNSILKAMNRLYTAEEWSDFALKAYDAVPDLCLGTDIMVGFPGETEKLFLDTKKFLADLPLAYFHVFNYSERKGTKTVKMPGKVTHAERARRSAILREQSERKRMTFHHRFIGKTLPVLFEEEKNGLYNGYTGNYIRVTAYSDKDISNRILRVKITEADGKEVKGSIVHNGENKFE
jgi:threonylcarbamoyladenosine tRNA methylthiotransferase MtaB